MLETHASANARWAGSLIATTVLAFTAVAYASDPPPLSLRAVAASSSGGAAAADSPVATPKLLSGAATEQPKLRRGRLGAIQFSTRINAAVRQHGAVRVRARHARWVASALAETRLRNVRRFDQLAREAAVRHSVPVDLVRAVILVESRYDARAVSRVGAIGLMQLMPMTAASLDVRDPYNARQNVFGGARLLRMLGETFEDPVLAIAAYNAGVDAVRRYGGVPPYRETRQYVGRVLRAYQHYRSKRLSTLHKATNDAPAPARVVPS